MKTSIRFVATLVAFIVVAGSISSCKKKEKENTYVIEYPVSFNVPAHTDNVEFDMVDTMLASKLSQTASAAGVSLDKVKSVKLNSMRLSIDPVDVANGATFDAYHYANAHLRTASNPEKQIAFITTVPQNKTELTFESQHEEWVDYLKQNEFHIRVKAYHETDVPPTNYTLNVSFDVVYMGE